MKRVFPILLIGLVACGLLINEISLSQKDRTPVLESLNSISTNHQELKSDNSGGSPYITVLSNNSSTSTNGRAPQGSRAFINSCYFISKGELDSSGFGADSIFSVGWNYEGSTFQSSITTGTLKVYLQNTNDLSYNKGTNFATAITGMTKVIDRNIMIPNDSGQINIDVPVGGAGTTLPFITNSLQGVYVAFEYQTTSALATPLGAPTIYCNTIRANSIGTYQSQVSNGTLMALSSFRPETRFGTKPDPPVDVRNIYSLGKYPYIHITDDTVCVEIVRKYLSDIDPRVCIKVINRDYPYTWKYSYGIDLPSLVSEDTIICFALPQGYEPKLEDIIVNALIGDTSHIYSGCFDPAEDSKRYCVQKTTNSYNYADECIPHDGGVGFNGATGNFVVKFKNSGTDTFKISNIDQTFFNSTSAPSRPYRLVIYNDNGSGRPGSLLYISSVLNTPVGSGAVQYVTNTVSPTVRIAGNSRFYVGYRQTSVNNIGGGFQYEIPARKKAFFYSSPDTSSTWTDFGDAGANFRLDVSPRGNGGTLNLTALIEGFYNGTLVRDTMRAYLRNTSSPYGIVDSARVYLSNSGTGIMTFPNAGNGINYYLQLKHRNSIETWSSTGNSFTSGSLTYNFTTSASQAFGSNMVQVDSSPLKFGIYSGDVNQDGVVDATDAGAIDNDAFTFVSGYVNTDLNGDSFVDATDGALCDNNASNFVGAVIP